MKTKNASGQVVTKVNTLHLDGLGSVRAVTNEAGLATERTAYRPFGEETPLTPVSALGLPETKGFIGERFDDQSGLQYLNARYYDPKLAMFIQPDWWEVMRPGVGTNRYAYSSNDPVNGRDPSGHLSTEDAAAIMSHHEGGTDDLPEHITEVDRNFLTDRRMSEEEADEMLARLDSCRCGAYYDKRANEISIVAGNTRDLNDMAENMAQTVGKSNDYAAAVAVAREWSDFASRHIMDLSFAGHSKGGGMATAMAMGVGHRQHMEADTIDPSTVSSATIRNLGLQPHHPSLDISNTIINGEILDLSRQVGAVIAPGVEIYLGLTGPRGTSRYLDPVAGVSRNPIVRHYLETATGVILGD